jgi:hypothetical protein
MKLIFESRCIRFAAVLTLLVAIPLRMDGGLASTASNPHFPPEAVAGAGALSRYGQLPIRFEPNVGQAPAAVQYLSRGAGYSVGLTRYAA